MDVPAHQRMKRCRGCAQSLQAHGCARSVPHCGNAMRVDGEPHCEPECSCGTRFCFACTEEPHSPCTCDMCGAAIYGLLNPPKRFRNFSWHSSGRLLCLQLFELLSTASCASVAHDMLPVIACPFRITQIQVSVVL